MKLKKKLILSLAFLCAVLAPLFAEYNSFGVPDSSEIRKEIADLWFNQDLESIRMLNSQIRKNQIGESFQVSLEEQENQFSVYVAPKTSVKVDVYDSRGVHTETEDAYSIDSCGTWVYTRNKEDGKPLFIKIYFSNNKDVYVQFRPYKNLCHADFVIFNCFASQSVPVGIPFEKLFTMSFSEAVQLTKNTLPWKYAVNTTGQHDASIIMAQTLKGFEKKIFYEDDAMYDEAGKPVSIKSGTPFRCEEKNFGKLVLSSCGYAKWVVDGLVEPMAGSFLKRGPLVEPTVEYKDIGFHGVLNSEYSINLSLDWTRNLAAAALSVRSGRTIYYKDSGVDVNIEPFTSVMTDAGISNTAGYIKNTGYEPKYLKALLYVLTQTEPDYFYLAAIRQTEPDRPELKVFNDCAIIFPYIDDGGKLRISVFMDGQEIKYSDFEKMLVKANECFVHLTRVKTDSVFYPMEKVIE